MGETTGIHETIIQRVQETLDQYVIHNGLSALAGDHAVHPSGTTQRYTLSHRVFS